MRPYYHIRGWSEKGSVGGGITGWIVLYMHMSGDELARSREYEKGIRKALQA